MPAPTRTPLSLWSFRRNRDDHRRLTLRVLAAPSPLWHGGDVADVLERTMIDVLLVPSTTHLPGWDLVPFLTTDQVRELASNDPVVLDRVEFIAGCLAVPTGSPRRLSAVRAIAPEPEPIVDLRAETFSVTAAAAILSRDPQIAVGRHTLLDALRAFGWVDLVNGAFEPAQVAVDAGHLVLNQVWTARTRTAYNRIRVTRTGLVAIQRALGGVTDLQLDVEHPTLLEIP